jgi:polysaccharide biosynthesis protein PslH
MKGSQRRRVLFMTPFPPRLDATHGGGRVVAQTIARLAERERVALLCLRLETEPPADELLRERCDLFEEVPRPLVGSSPMRLWAQRQRLPLLLSGAPQWVVGCSVAAYGERLRSILGSWRPDVVQMEYAVMGQYARLVDRAATARVLVEHDAGQGGGGRSWRRYRSSVMKRADAVVVFTRRDEEVLRPLAGAAPLARIPFAADIPSAALDPTGHDPPSLLFVGNYSHEPNVEAARRLAERIFPRLRERYPELVLYLVGEGLPNDLVGPGAVATGWVDDVTPYLDGAAVVVVPLSSGGGMRVKVLEALAAGKAVVASPLAVDGLDVTDGKEVLLAGDDDAFVSEVLMLLADPERRRAQASRARAWALANLSWDTSIRAYQKLYDSLLERRGAEAP